ncbi:hypothetical protein ZWY2020_025861 [Hordeum vulgare]|nr:hypothetical protein ZWY2020_025861 [Hordeum vulgare]
MATAQFRPLSSSSSASAAARPRAFRAAPSRVAAAASASGEPARRLAAEFDPAVPLASAVTPPSGWYTDPGFLRLELDRVFLRGWQAVGHIGQVKNPNDFFTGSLGNVEFVICRDANGKLQAFHNVSSSCLTRMWKWSEDLLQCPYHGWTYGLDGTLLKATRISGIRNFNKNDFGLLPIKVATWGPFVLARFDDSSQDTVHDVVGDEWLGSASDLLSRSGINTSLPHICRREYIIEYIRKVSVQRCESAPAEQEDIDRLGTKLPMPLYGPWMDTNLAVPLDATRCKVDDQDFINRSLKDSEQVQIEDIALCEGVQRGLASPAYGVGRYAPSVEMAMHHFHCLLHTNLSGQ